jgi:formylglycine-generating enzyme required for sulfatase activity/dienelactone hydrolase
VIKARIPKGFFAWKVEKPGFATSYDTTTVVATAQLKFPLQESGAAPLGMVHVTAPPRPFKVMLAGVENAAPVTLHDFWIDRHEVTNREYKQFIEAGGYRNRAFWRHPFVRNGQTLTIEEAMRLLTDSTGRPGPATWESGGYPEGQDDVPVGGVGWYEAAAYAAYAGKSLPTIYDWGYVASNVFSQYYVPRSNFRGKGPMSVGASGGMNRFGAFDMAGNMKEWCWNSADASRRYILGGAWDEPVYMFVDADAQAPFDRKANYGFRCVKYSPDQSPTAAGAGAVSIQKRDYSNEKPVGDAVFDAYRRLYAYDRIDLTPALDSVDDSNPEWRRENVSFSAGYGDERLPAAVFLPKTGHPPYQAVVYFPGSAALRTPSSRDLMVFRFDWIMKSGRAVIHPVFKSTYERRDALTSDTAEPTVAYRDHVVAWAREVSRAVDYLQTRSDIAADRIAFVGDSWGAYIGPIVVVLEPRFRACVLVSGGLDQSRSFPEADPFNFAPRVTIPVLLLGGRYDFYSPADSLQVLLFRLFATPNDQKRQVIFESGHMIPRIGMVRESLDWLDRYLGPPR